MRAILLFLVSFNLFAQTKSMTEVIMESGLTFDSLKKSVLSKNSCAANDLFFKACIHSLNQITFSLEDNQFLMVPPGAKIANYPKGLKSIDANAKTADLLMAMIDQDYFKTLNPSDFYETYKKLMFFTAGEWLKYAMVKKVAVDTEAMLDWIRTESLNGDIELEKKMTVVALDHYLVNRSYDNSKLLSNKYWDTLKVDTKVYVGIGTMMQEVDDGALIAEVFEGGGASDAGIQQYDIVTEVDGASIKGKTIQEIVQVVGGDEGTVRKFKVKRDNKIIDISVTLKKISREKVRSFYYDSANTLVIEYDDFMSEKSYEKIEEIIKDPKYAKAKRIILDLRGNGGGLLSEAVNIADLFLPEEQTVVFAKNLFKTTAADGLTMEYKVIPLTTSRPVVTDLPLVILVDHRSASASELLSQALADHGRAILVGRTTFGKGTVQANGSYQTQFDTSILRVKGESYPDLSIKYTSSIFLSPLKKSNTNVGVVPHFDVKDPTTPADFHETRMDEYAYNPVPTQGEQPAYKPTPELKDCVEKNSDFRTNQYMKSVKIRKSRDYQLMYALDVAKCL